VAAPWNAPYVHDLAPELTEATADSVALAWSAPPNEPADVRTWLQHDGATDEAQGGSFVVGGLEDNTEVHARLYREGAGWKVLGPEETFRTLNLPPPAPTGDARGGYEEANVSWSESAHDFARIEVHVGTSPDFVPGDATLKATDALPSGSLAVPLPPGPAFVRLVAVDTGGATNASDAMNVTVAQRPPPPPPAPPRVEITRAGVNLTWQAGAAGIAAHVVLLAGPGPPTRGAKPSTSASPPRPRASRGSSPTRRTR
jgi:hypothetical protein